MEFHRRLWSVNSLQSSILKMCVGKFNWWNEDWRRICRNTAWPIVNETLDVYGEWKWWKTATSHCTCATENAAIPLAYIVHIFNGMSAMVGDWNAYAFIVLSGCNMHCVARALAQFHKCNG